LCLHALAQPNLDAYGEVGLRRRLGRTKLEWNEPDATDYLNLTLDMADALPHRELPDWVSPRSSQFQARRHLLMREVDTGNLGAAGVLQQQLKEMSDDGPLLHRAMAHEAAHFLAYYEGDFEEALRTLEDERRVLVEMGDVHELLVVTNNIAGVEVRLGQPEAAAKRMAESAEEFIELGDIDLLTAAIETLGGALGHIDGLWCARAFGCARPIREELGLLRGEADERVLDTELAQVRASVAPSNWDKAFAQGQGRDPVEMMRELAAATRAETA
jgi:hypothetical protein